MIRILLDFQLVASTVHSEALKSSEDVTERGKEGGGRQHPQVEDEGAQGSSLSQDSVPPEETWVSETHSVSLVSCSFLAPRFGDLLAVHVLGTDSYHFQVIFLGESS